MKNKNFHNDEFDKEFPDRDIDKEKREFIERIKSVKKEEIENNRVIDDVDQRELAKSMTAFFGTLVEEAKGDKEGN
jgi:predicted GNAT family acetyltransferase